MRQNAQSQTEGGRTAAKRQLSAFRMTALRKRRKASATQRAQDRANSRFFYRKLFPARTEYKPNSFAGLSYASGSQRACRQKADRFWDGRDITEWALFTCCNRFILEPASPSACWSA